MKRLIPILVLLFLPTVVMGEEIVLTCRDKDGSSTWTQSLKLNLKTNKVQFGESPESDIYFRNDEHIVWIYKEQDTFVLRAFYRKTGRLRSNLTSLTTIYDPFGPKAPIHWSFQNDFWCFKPL